MACKSEACFGMHHCDLGVFLDLLMVGVGGFLGGLLGCSGWDGSSWPGLVIWVVPIVMV